MFKNLLLVVWVFRQIFKNLFLRSIKPQPYSNAILARVNPDVFDLPTYAAIKVGRDFESIVEIGAAGGGRITAVKQALQAVNAVAMDIGPNYRFARSEGGVTFQFYDPAAIPSNSLVFCVGTLNCIDALEIDALFAEIAAKKCWLLIFEPQLPFHIRRSMRRASNCWYHPYDLLAFKNGLEPKSQHKTWPHTASLKNFERWTCALYQAKS